MARGRYAKRKAANDAANIVPPAAAVGAAQTPVALAPVVDVDVRGSAFGLGARRTATEETALPLIGLPSSNVQRRPRQVLARPELRRLTELSKELAKLHRAEQKLLRERDKLVGQLRLEGESWASLSSRTGLSRQALSKRSK